MPEFDDPRIQAIYEAGQRRIDAMRAELLAQGNELQLPFRCYGCDQMRTDFCMMTGDGLPLCWGCFGACEGAFKGVADVR